MNYQEAVKLAQEWTRGQDVSLDGWRSVIAVLLERVTVLETANKNLHDHIRRLGGQIEALSLDLGIQEQDFLLPKKD